MTEFFSDCPLPDSYVEDHFRVRHQLDKTSNYQGKLLTEICQIIFVYWIVDFVVTLLGFIYLITIQIAKAPVTTC